MTIIGASENYVSQLLEQQLDSAFCYHNLPHSLAVKNACQELAAILKLSDEAVEILQLASLFHDTGFVEVYLGHEEVSCRIAKDFLQSKGYSPKKLDKVLNCIKATAYDISPTNALEEIMKDADLSNLADPDYLILLENLRKEWAHFLNESYEDPEWFQLNYRFVKDHRYYTSAAKGLYNGQRNKNAKTLKKLIKGKKEVKKKTDLKPGIAASRSAQMMFKTSLRNHLDLSNLADNKANIMLSVNALIITVTMPLTATYAEGNNLLLIPIIALMGTCLVSMIFATLATRPIKMTGYTDPQVIKDGKSNLFFFGNFYKMSFPEYQEGMQKIITDDDQLEETIMRDLFFLGRSLGFKYQRLRVCYTIFMYGITASVILFAIIFKISVA